MRYIIILLLAAVLITGCGRPPIIIGFNETHLQIKKSVPAEPKRYALLIKRREAPHF